MTKEEKAKVLSLMILGREYAIDIIAAGRVKAEVMIASTVGNDIAAGELRKVQGELHTRIQEFEQQIVSEIAKNVE